eukprot:1366005-Rhodomonas_salina.6
MSIRTRLVVCKAQAPHPKAMLPLRASCARVKTVLRCALSVPPLFPEVEVTVQIGETTSAVCKLMH